MYVHCPGNDKNNLSVGKIYIKFFQKYKYVLLFFCLLHISFLYFLSMF